jgi:type II secretory ATPase GspE/PulE/Tfp pilus assembly ATPase PilB-like protein
MVGEIRDQETAQTAVEASLTGHLLLSTLHTNSAPETITRLLDMGMDPFNFADALLGVLAQRLVRRLCNHCRVARTASPEEEEELLQDHMHVVAEVENPPDASDVLADWRRRFGTDGRLTLYRSVGCEHCAGTGYRGRAGIHELMMVSRGLRHLIQTGKRADELQRHALGEGMRTLRQDGIEKVLAGVTTIEEVRANS